MHDGQKNPARPSRDLQSGFTLIEVALAVCIVLLALVPLLKLHVTCLRTHDVAMQLSRATLLANAQLTELTIREDLSPGRHRGHFDNNSQDRIFHWSAVVKALPDRSFGLSDATALRHIQLQVDWKDGNTNRDIRLETVVKVKTPVSVTPKMSLAPDLR
jgi:Tfp pilus assembly protein PilV